MIKGMYGRGADDTYISVPQGTTVTDAETGELLGDLVEADDELVVAKGGRGGRGNIKFASPKIQLQKLLKMVNLVKKEN